MRPSVRAATTVRLSKPRITDISVEVDDAEVEVTGWETHWVTVEGKTVGTLRLICRARSTPDASPEYSHDG